MSTKREASERIALLQGTLDLLILSNLAMGPRHGHGIAVAIQDESDDLLLVDHGSLYPALQRLQDKGMIRAEWGVSDNNRRARFYELTARGKKQLVEQTRQWRQLAKVIGRILGPEKA